MPNDTNRAAALAPYALTVPAAVAFSGFTRSRLYQLAAEGKLSMRRAGRRSMILTAELQAVIDDLPPAPITRKAAA